MTMALIDKDALIGKIEERMQELHPTDTHKMQVGEKVDRDVLMWLNALSWVKDFLDTLEVTKIDPDELSKELKKAVEIYKPTGNFGWGTLYNIAWHFYELGLKTQKGE